MPIDTAYVHIGLHKTGTTSIQLAFARHRRALLARHQLIYPAVSTNHSGPLFSMFCRDPEQYAWNVVHGTSGEAVAEQNRAFAQALAGDLALPGRSLVLSGEDLCRLGQPAVQRFAHWLAPQVRQVRILAYVREPVAWSASHVQQQVRKGKTLEELFALNLAPRWRKRLEPWLLTFGADCMSVHDFDVARHHQAGLVGQFAEQVGLPEPAYRPMLSRHANERFSAEAVALLSALNRLKPRFVDQRLSAARAPQIDKMFGRITGARFALPPAIATQILAAAAPDLAWLKEKFGISFAAPVATKAPTPTRLFGEQETLDQLALLLWELAGAPR